MAATHIAKRIKFCGADVLLVCDAKCEKAWGMNHRPRENENEEDSPYMKDERLGIAPINPGTSEGADFKPVHVSERLNKWCARECERASLICLDGTVPPPYSIPQWANNKQEGE